MSRRMSPVADRIWKFVTDRPPNGCWTWTGSVDGKGYGKIWDNGSLACAHRAIYELLVGPVPDGLELDHLCRNRRCCNPAHLEPVTHRENTVRGIAPAAVNAAKTHCIHGHLLSGDNLHIKKNGKRECRTCAYLGNCRRLGIQPYACRDRRAQSRTPIDELRAV